MGGWLNHQLLYGFVVGNLRYEECIKMNKKNRSSIDLPAPPPPKKKKKPAALGFFTKSGLNNSKSQQKKIMKSSSQLLEAMFDTWSHLLLFLVGLSKGCTSPICQGDASRIGSIYGPLLLGCGEVIHFDPGKNLILRERSTWKTRFLEIQRFVLLNKSIKISESPEVTEEFCLEFPTFDQLPMQLLVRWKLSLLTWLAAAKKRQIGRWRYAIIVY